MASPTTTTGFTAAQLQAVVITERVNSGLSLVGIFFIVGTFVFSSAFNSAINRLIFFASCSNLGLHIATMVSEAGPAAGALAPLCQFQAFLIQMFLGVDAFWAFCMACNVYLAFFRGYTLQQLRALDARYLLASYMLAFIPAIVLLFVDGQARGRIYGPAGIWCWVSLEWEFLRIAVLYGFVWVAIVFAMGVYFMAGKVIYQQREHLDGFLNPFNENPFANTITTEIEITHNARDSTFINPYELGIPYESEFNPYTVNIEVVPHERPAQPLPALLRIRSLTREAAAGQANADAWLYARVAFLFFVALLVTWIPSSVNRVYSLAYPDVVNFPLNYVSAFVFSLQGFWNAIVYIITSRTACKTLWNDIRGRPRPPGPGTGANPAGKRARFSNGPQARTRSGGSSITSLAGH